MNNKITEKNRHYYNLKILKRLEYMINTYPDIRFTQLLYNMGIDNTEHRYNEESNITYNKITNKIKNHEKY